ncbi:unnamed protein product [Eretmochelys imbricata]
MTGKWTADSWPEPSPCSGCWALDLPLPQAGVRRRNTEPGCDGADGMAQHILRIPRDGLQ